MTLKEMPAINTDAVLADIKKLSSDEFGGRTPGSKGEELTVQYLTQQFKAAGAEPGNPDGTLDAESAAGQPQATDQSPLVFKKGGKSLTLKPHDDVIAFSQRVTDTIAVKDSDVVFVGYGVQAPEFKWDDFKGMDVKGKTIIVLVNDPPVPRSERQERARCRGRSAARR